MIVPVRELGAGTRVRPRDTPGDREALSGVQDAMFTEPMVRRHTARER